MTMDGSRRRRHQHDAQSAWLAAYRTARWARRFLSRPLPDTTKRGTSYGWITIDVQPSQRTWGLLKIDRDPIDDAPSWYWVNSCEPGRGHASPADRNELAGLLGLVSVHQQGLSIPAGRDYWQEYVDRAEGREPTVIGQPYWD